MVAGMLDRAADALWLLKDEFRPGDLRRFRAIGAALEIVALQPDVTERPAVTTMPAAAPPRPQQDQPRAAGCICWPVCWCKSKEPQP